MANDTRRRPQRDEDRLRDDEDDDPIPRASDEQVLDETVRMAREGRRKLEDDPTEPKPEQ